MEKINLLNSLEFFDAVSITYNVGTDLECNEIARYLGRGERGYLFKGDTANFEFSEDFLKRKDDMKIEFIEED